MSLRNLKHTNTHSSQLTLPLPGHSGNNRQSKRGRMEETGQRRSPCPIYHLPWKPWKLCLPPIDSLPKHARTVQFMTECTGRQMGTYQHTDQVQHAHWTFKTHLYRNNNTTNAEKKLKWMSEVLQVIFLCLDLKKLLIISLIENTIR